MEIPARPPTRIKPKRLKSGSDAKNRAFEMATGTLKTLTAALCLINRF